MLGVPKAFYPDMDTHPDMDTPITKPLYVCLCFIYVSVMFHFKGTHIFYLMIKYLSLISICGDMTC